MKKDFFVWMFLILICMIACKEDHKDEVRAMSSNNVQDFIENPIQSDGTIDTTKVAKMLFAEKTFDFGEVEEGDQLIHKFKFTNAGSKPLIISNASSTCGCTIPEWPKEPIASGGSGEIEVKFNTAGKLDNQIKPIRIYANTWPNETIVYVKAIVHKKTEL